MGCFLRPDQGAHVCLRCDELSGKRVVRSIRTRAEHLLASFAADKRFTQFIEHARSVLQTVATALDSDEYFDGASG